MLGGIGINILKEMKESIDKILNEFHNGRIDLIEVRKQLLILFSKYIPESSVCECISPNPYPKENLTDFYCTRCVKNIRNTIANGK